MAYFARRPSPAAAPTTTHHRLLSVSLARTKPWSATAQQKSSGTSVEISNDEAETPGRVA